MIIALFIALVFIVAFFVWTVWQLVAFESLSRRRDAEHTQAQAAFRHELEEARRYFVAHERARRASKDRHAR